MMDGGGGGGGGHGPGGHGNFGDAKFRGSPGTHRNRFVVTIENLVQVTDLIASSFKAMSNDGPLQLFLRQTPFC